MQSLLTSNFFKKKTIVKEQYNQRMEIKQRCTEAVVIVKLANGKCKVLRALLDSGCTKTMILKEFTEQGNRKHLPPEQQITYKTYGA